MSVRKAISLVREQTCSGKLLFVSSCYTCRKLHKTDLSLLAVPVVYCGFDGWPQGAEGVCEWAEYICWQEPSGEQCGCTVASDVVSL